MSNVADFLNMTPQDTPESVVLPEGSYEFSVTSYRADEVGENSTPLIRLNVKAVGVIDSDLTDDKLGNAEPTRMEFWATPNALKVKNPATGLKSFLTSGLDMGHVDDLPYSELLEMAIGKTFKGLIKHEMVGKNKDILQASVKRIL
jgi:hypothetical protein|tara:strand:- start:14424 stop:14861 length:438 start_codon:yes stop_codon:yes gene_type:complete